MTINRFPHFVSWLMLTALIVTNAKADVGVPPNQVITICEGSYTVLNAETPNAVAYQWYLNGQTIVSANDKKYTAGKAGVYTVIAFNKESCASDVSDGIEVAVKASAGITFDPLADKTIGDAPFKLNAVSANNNNMITYTASPAGIVTINNDLVTVIGVGDVEITATTTGTNSCGNAIMAKQTLKVKPVTVTNKVGDLAIVASSESRVVTTEQPFEYTLAVKNQTTSLATNVSVTDTLPAALSFIAVNNAIEGKATYDEKSRLLTWKMDQLKASAYSELRFSAKATRHGTIKNTAQVAMAEHDSNLSNNTSVDYKDISGITIPNVFTPNGDGKNDTFTIPDIAQFQENQLIIVNRWGGEVYQSKNYQNNWTGNNLDEGTYFYSLKVKNNKGEQEEYKGYVTLLRAAAI